MGTITHVMQVSMLAIRMEVYVDEKIDEVDGPLYTQAVENAVEELFRKSPNLEYLRFHDVDEEWWKRDETSMGPRGCTREEWQRDGASRERGLDWFRRLYTRNAGDTIGLFDAHRDFGWISVEITYGLYLSDRQVLDDVDTEMVVLPAIMTQNLPNETGWHIRGTRRIGVSFEDTEVVCSCIHRIAEHFGVRLNKVPTVKQIEPEV